MVGNNRLANSLHTQKPKAMVPIYFKWTPFQAFERVFSCSHYAAPIEAKTVQECDQPDTAGEPNHAVSPPALDACLMQDE